MIEDHGLGIISRMPWPWYPILWYSNNEKLPLLNLDLDSNGFGRPATPGLSMPASFACRRTTDTGGPRILETDGAHSTPRALLIFRYVATVCNFYGVFHEGVWLCEAHVQAHFFQAFYLLTLRVPNVNDLILGVDAHIVN